MARLVHRHPIVNGYSGMIPDFHRSHQEAGNQGAIRATGPDPTELMHLKSFGARYWVVHLDETPEGAATYWGGTAHGLRLLGTFDSAMILEDAAERVADQNCRKGVPLAFHEEVI